jgi:Tol biopolymer transport system component
VTGYDPAVPAVRGRAAKTRIRLGGENGAVVPEQIVNITLTPPLPGTNIPDELHPAWTPTSEQFIYFVKNADVANGQTVATRYQIFRVDADASSNSDTGVPAPPVRITNDPNSDFFFPAISANLQQIAFTRSIGGGPAQLYVAALPASGFINLTPAGGLVSLTQGKTFRGKTFAEVRRPAWVGTGDLVFAGRFAGEQNFHIFSVSIGSGAIFQLTDGPASEENPAVSPAFRNSSTVFIAFDSNASGYTGGGIPLQNNPIAGESAATSSGVVGTRDIFVMTSLSANARQFTSTYAGAPGTINVQPAWSREESNPQINPLGQDTYIAFASTRRPSAPGAADFVAGDTFDIYYLNAEESAPGSQLTRVEGTPGVAAPPRPAAPGAANPARRLDTADPGFQYNDTYPAWPRFISIRRLCHQSNRSGMLRQNTGGLGPFPGGTPPSFNLGFTPPTGNVHDLFITTLVDINAPTLLRYDFSSASGEIVHINQGSTFVPSTAASVRDPRQGLVPGSTAFFTVRVEDRESGMRPSKAVYLMFKDPDSKYQDAQRVEHKEFSGNASILFENNAHTGHLNGFGVNFGFEYEAEAISAADRTTYFRHNASNLNPGPLYTASTGVVGFGANARQAGDATAFSGAYAPPLDGGTYTIPGRPTGNTAAPFFFADQTVTTANVWLELRPLPAEQQDNQGGVLYGASWQVPNTPSDWYIDVIAYDNAVNPLNVRERSNWIIYDNVWGFSTQQFSGVENLLVVADYTLGQKFFTSSFAGRRTNVGNNNLLPVFFGAESYYTDLDLALQAPVNALPAPGSTDPRGYNQLSPFLVTILVGNATSGGINRGFPNVLGVNSYTDQLNDDQTRITDGPPGNLVARPFPPTQRYNIWRVLSRGRVTPADLNAYLPEPDIQTPADLRVGETTPRTARTINRMVIWASPFSGDLFVGPGTITDANTQDDLTNFVSRGGRLFISGQDVGFALTFNGGRSNNFFNNVLKAEFVTDEGGDGFIQAVTTGVPDTLVATDAWFNGRHAYGRFDGTNWVYDPPSNGLIGLTNAFGGTPTSAVTLPQRRGTCGAAPWT